MTRLKHFGFVRNREGATAVEFALVFPIFLMLTFSVLEAGWFFFVQSAVEEANSRAARLIRTGQVQNGGVSKDAFFDEICNIVDTFGDCSENLTVGVSRYSTFADLAADLQNPVCRDEDDGAVDALPYNAGAQRDIVRVRVCFLYKPLNPGIGLSLANTDDGKRKIVSVAIFRNEPYSN